jgi:hypothetical protein
LTRYGYLTRLYTTISPVEMTEDPLFHERADLPDVTNRVVADRRVGGSGAIGMITPEGRAIALEQDGSWPAFDASMPWAERVEEIPASGPVLELVDNATLIELLLEDWNATRAWPQECGGIGSGGTGGGLGSGGFGGGSGGAGQGATATANSDSVEGGGGCGCSLPGAPARAPAALLLVPLVLWRRRVRARD